MIERFEDKEDLAIYKRYAGELRASGIETLA
jgi:hypothetical protein